MLNQKKVRVIFNLSVMFMAVIFCIISLFTLVNEIIVSKKLHSITISNYSALSAYDTSEGFKIPTAEAQEEYDKIYKENLIKRENLINSFSKDMQKFAVKSTASKLFDMLVQIIKIAVAVVVFFTLRKCNFMLLRRKKNVKR